MDMKGRVAAIAGIALFALPLAFPFAASAQVYYYAPNTTSGAFNYGSSQYIPAAAQPYVQMGQQIQQQMQQQYGGYSYPMNYGYGNYYPGQSQYQYQSQSQYSYPSYQYYYQPSYGYSYGYNQPYSNYYAYGPQSYSYLSGTYDAFGTPLCGWSDYSGYTSCSGDPQQWNQDPYTGQWY